jgi:serine/threonine-protein kinase RsbW
MTVKRPVLIVRQTADSICFTFSSTMKNIDDVCEQTNQYIRLNLNDIDDLLFSINLVIREGLTNAVRHGNADDPAKMVRFLFTIVNKTSIRLMIQDEGDGFDWRKQQAAGLFENTDHGRGIRIIGMYFNRYSYNDKGNILYLEKDLSS